MGQDSSDRRNFVSLRTVLIAATTALLALSSTFGVVTASSSRSAGRTISVIVEELPGSGREPEDLVESLGGEIQRHIGIIHGFVADIPGERVEGLEGASGIHSVTPDREIELQSHNGTYDPQTDPGSIYNTTQTIGARRLWSQAIKGSGVGVALIDSGVVPVDGLTGPGKIVNGPDLSFESQAANLRYLDSFGHGTHMAGLIAGREQAASTDLKSDAHNFIGVAPNATLVNVKVADAHGTTDVSQVIAAIDWVVQHRNDKDLNIRVLNLSFGTDGIGDYEVDPLAHAAEVAWRRGIVVVVAAGNTGFGNPKVNNPAYDPYVLAVGADDTKGTVKINDDRIPKWSAPGDSTRRPDLVAPGQSLASLRDPNSYLDQSFPTARIGERYFRGSGTSQAAAVVSGAAALLLQDRPGLTPDQVKRLLTSTATRLTNADPAAQGAGLLNVDAAKRASTPATKQTHKESTGLGTLELSRGSTHLSAGGVTLKGELDIFAWPWLGASWAVDIERGGSWDGGDWNGGTWSGGTWSGTGDPLSGAAWEAVSWIRPDWSAIAWSLNPWPDKEWTGNRWTDGDWKGNRWTGEAWSGNTWSTSNWGG